LALLKNDHAEKHLHDRLSHLLRDDDFKSSSIKSQFRINLLMALIKNGLVDFYEYEIDRARWQLSWREEPIPLNRKTFDLLLYLIDHRERVVGKEELLNALWPEQFIEESNLSQHVFLLRKALSRHDSGGKLIETVPGRGYRFTAPVLEPEPVPVQMTIDARESITRITFEEEQTDSDDALQVNALSRSPVVRSRRILLIAMAAAGTVLAVAGWLGWQRWENHSGGAPVQVVLAPMEGTTGDPILDKSLTQALRIDLAQSPYVSLVPSSTVRATLTSMMHKPDDTITPEIAREICERTNSQGVLSGNIARIGQHFLITEEAVNCVDSTVVAAAKYEAAKPEDLPHAIDKLAASLRQKLGESRRSIARFNMPLFEQNTASLAALKAYTQGTEALVRGKIPEGIALLKTAVAADPLFPAAHYNLAAAYGTVGDDLHVRESILQAWNLKDRATESTRFGIETMYQSEYTGDQYALLRSFQNWVTLYPKSSQAWSGLASAQRSLCMDSDALASSLRTIELLPHSQGMLANLALDQMRNGDPKAALATCERALHDNLDGDGIRVRYLQTAYLLHDPALLKEQRAWAEAHPDAMGVLGVESQIAMAEGRFADARKMIERIRDLHRQQGLTGPDDERAKFQAVDLMQAGDLEAGKEIFQLSPVDIEIGQEVLGLVYVGDFAAAEAAVRANKAKYPRATMWTFFWEPRIKAAIAMADHKPAEAAADLESARRFDRIGRFLPWTRGNAYLAAGQPGLAEKDYGDVTSHPEVDPVSPYISLSWLGLGRALASEGKRAAAIDAYHHFLTLWSHADPDGSTFKQAKKELAGLEQPLPRP
jgi:DNA-binding winged helix-turn-helix (wHTH) protein/tetratricopeptide (TPR) repeat protein